jgi:hypothetical protein
MATAEWSSVLLWRGENEKLRCEPIGSNTEGSGLAPGLLLALAGANAIHELLIKCNYVCGFMNESLLCIFT